MLLDIYSPDEIEHFRQAYGDDIINYLYEEEFGDTECFDSNMYGEKTVDWRNLTKVDEKWRSRKYSPNKKKNRNN